MNEIITYVTPNYIQSSYQLSECERSGASPRKDSATFPIQTNVDPLHSYICCTIAVNIVIATNHTHCTCKMLGVSSNF